MRSQAKHFEQLAVRWAEAGQHQPPMRVVDCLDDAEQDGDADAVDQFGLVDGLRLVLLCTSIQGYENLCELITKARRAAPKGEYRLAREDMTATQGLLALWLPGETARKEEATRGHGDAAKEPDK